jgi:hypothetical protein
VTSLKVGDVLNVQLQSGPRPIALLAVDSAGSVAGSLTPLRLPQIIDCMQQGYSYVAVVQQKNAGQVKVEIRPQ